MIAVDAGVTINVEVTELWMSVEKIKLVNDLGDGTAMP